MHDEDFAAQQELTKSLMKGLVKASLTISESPLEKKLLAKVRPGVCLESGEL